MAFTLGELARLVQGTVRGDASCIIEGASTIRDAKESDITLADSNKVAAQLVDSHAVAVVVNEKFVPEGKNVIVVPNVHAAFAAIVSMFRPRHTRRPVGISPLAVIDPTAQVAVDAQIHPGVVVDAGVTIGAGSILYPGVHVMAGSRIGANTTLFANVVLYENTIIGDRCILHANAVIGAYGFGYDSSSGKHILSAQLGNVEIGDDVEIGAGTTIDRGTYSATMIGSGTKIDNQVMIGHNCRLGKHNLICSQVGIAGSCTTGDYVVMAGQVGIGDHIDIGSQATLAAKAGVMNDIPAKSIFVGIPATPYKEQMQKQAVLSKLPEMRKEFKEVQRRLDMLEKLLNSEASKDAA